jgi:isoleucyl-tRNA synthetase
VALDINMDESLVQEGSARELVNKIQRLRKDKGYEVTDRINISIEQHESITSAVENFKPYICSEILAEEINLSDALSLTDEIEVNEALIKVSIERKN